MMHGEEGQPGNGEPHDRFFIVSGDEIDRVVVPLTVVHGYVQLLRRRAQRDDLGPDDLERSLAEMEKATTAIIAELRAILKATSRLGGDTGVD